MKSRQPNPFAMINDAADRYCYYCGKQIKRRTLMIVSGGKIPFHRNCYKRAEKEAEKELRKNPKQYTGRKFTDAQRSEGKAILTTYRAGALTKSAAAALLVAALGIDRGTAYEVLRLKGKKNPDFFGADAVAGAKRVTKIRSVTARDSGERGEIVGTAPGGFVKVKWHGRAKPSLIKRSELRRANPGEYTPNKICGTCGRKANDPFRSYDQSGKIVHGCIDDTHTGHLITPSASNSWHNRPEAKRHRAAIKKHLGSIGRARRNPGLMEIAGGLQALDYLSGKLKKKNPNTSTRTEVRSPTRTSTSTKAHTSGNVTVTGGAGAGANTTVNIVGKRKKKNPNGLRKEFWIGPQGQQLTIYDVVDASGKKLATFYGSKVGVNMAAKRYENDKDLVRAVEDLTGSKVRLFKYQHKGGSSKAIARRNPSVREMSERFQGKASGSVQEYYASDHAPRLDFSRAGKLVFLKLQKGKQLRIPGAVVTIDPRTEKLWIAGNRAPLFNRKAKTKGELLDFGPVSDICYLTAKKHIGNNKPYEYVHPFGEEGGTLPHLCVDYEGMPVLRGGSYRVKSEGIVD